VTRHGTLGCTLDVLHFSPLPWAWFFIDCRQVVRFANLWREFSPCRAGTQVTVGHAMGDSGMKPRGDGRHGPGWLRTSPSTSPCRPRRRFAATQNAPHLSLLSQGPALPTRHDHPREKSPVSPLGSLLYISSAQLADRPSMCLGPGTKAASSDSLTARSIAPGRHSRPAHPPPPTLGAPAGDLSPRAVTPKPGGSRSRGWPGPSPGKMQLIPP